jgi:hypothetical protein
VRSYLIDGGRVSEVPLQIVPDREVAVATTEELAATTEELAR